MAPTKTKKRGSDASTKQRGGVAVPLKDAPSTPTHRSPIKKRKAGISLQQKKTLIDNLQLEIAERARRLRAQYHLQAQGLRSRVEIRVNRIPTSLRKMKMEDLLHKYLNQEQNPTRPPVPAKDLPARAAANNRGQPAGRTPRHMNEITGDKENDVENEGPKKRPRGGVGDKGPVRPAQVLSPTSSNSRLVNRDNAASPAKSHLNRPGSPLKSTGTGSAAKATSVLSSMVEKAKAARSGSPRKATNSSTANARAGTTATTAKTRRGGGATKQQPSRPATRTGRRLSNQSETSEGSASTVVRKAAQPKASTATNKKSVMSSIRKGATAKTATAPTTSSSGRVLRKRT